jgi:alpha-galactosidase
MRPVIVLIGAGSMVFTRSLVSDLMHDEATRDSELRLVDIDPARLGTAAAMVRRIQAEAASHGRVTATVDRRQALPGAGYVVTTVQVGGRAAIDLDFDIPARFGIRQTVADTLGIGGISRALRTIPVVLDIVRDIEELAPDALHLNYSNPMAMIVMAATARSSIRHLGLCHSIPNTAAAVALYLEVLPPELRWEAAGINHMAWMLRLEKDGEDLYPRLLERADDPGLFPYDAVRFELLRHVG